MPLPGSAASGEQAAEPENPETLKRMLDAIKNAESADYPRLLVMMLSVLRMQNPKNWAKVRDELVGLIRAEVSQ